MPKAPLKKLFRNKNLKEFGKLPGDQKEDCFRASVKEQNWIFKCAIFWKVVTSCSIKLISLMDIWHVCLVGTKSRMVVNKPKHQNEKRNYICSCIYQIRISSRSSAELVLCIGSSYSVYHYCPFNNMCSQGCFVIWKPLLGKHGKIWTSKNPKFGVSQTCHHWKYHERCTVLQKFIKLVKTRQLPKHHTDTAVWACLWVSPWISKYPDLRTSPFCEYSSNSMMVT